ncbi:WcaI family glycosyltransferase [Pseudogemmobacter humi]|uniref:Alpha-D-kanosaminyltransferase n=1 Tax=Pseudogemmobacter humi TaxID=2483812 RepID=A0A3P5XUK8_9RHOB|nr:WcaI family glycosyltransferase [Pseudogemmobacter humi]VDC33974.1 Alpha-D-kanosaminyltransferase [Pseudogemmobacter humi]
MKLLILGINFTPEMISTGLYTTDLAEMMARAGDEVSVVTAQPYYPAWKIFPGHSRFLWKSGRLGSGVRYVRCPHYVPAKPSGARRIIHHATFAMTALPVLAWKTLIGRPDMVLVVAPALLPAPLAWALARLSGAKLWLHVQDFEVEAAFATGLLKRDGFAGRIAERFDRWIHRRFDRVSTISGPMLRKLSEKGLPPARIFELRNWARLDAVAPLTGPSPYRAEFGITEEHVLLYSGNIANKQGLEILADAARLLAHRKDLRFVICGQGPFLDELKTLSAGLENISFFPLQPLERLGDLMGLASLHLLPQIAGVSDSVLPSKLTNMLASGRPVLATAEPGTALAEAVAGCGRVTPPGDAAALAGAITALLDAPDQRETLGRAARDRALEQWDSTRILGRFRHAAHELTGKTLPAAAVTDSVTDPMTSRSGQI